MTRICIVGNSHVAALKLGWDEIKGDAKDTEVTFFGVPGKWLRNVNVDTDAGTLTPETGKHKRFFQTLSGGSDTIRISDYDSFVVVGLELSIFRWMAFYKQMRQAPFNLTIGTPQIMSAEVFDAARANIFAGTSGQVVYEALREAGAKNVHVCPQPMPAPGVREGDAFWAAMEADEDMNLVDASYREDLARGFPDAASIVWQPDTSLVDTLITNQDFSHGSRRINLERSHGDDDFQHMNAAYGAMILQGIIEAST